MVAGVAVTRAKVFLSWCHADKHLKDALLAPLRPALGWFVDLQIEWWEDSHLSCGEDLQAAIVGQLDEADYGVLLLSTSYFSRPFIRKHELPRFAGLHADKGSLPVALSPLMGYDGTWNMHGVERQTVFTLDGRTFEELAGVERKKFANELASSIRRRLLGLNGYRPL